MKKVLVIGAGFLQRYVIQKAKAMGYYTLAVDGNPNAVGLAYADAYGVVDIVDEAAVCTFAREHQVDGVLTAATDYGVLAAAYTARELGLPGIRYESAKRIKNKYEVRKCLYEAGADDTGLAHEVSEETDVAALANAVTYPVMVKPCDGSGSRGAAKVERAEDFAAVCKDAMACSLTRKATVEPFIIGREYGVEFYVENGEIHVLAVMQKWMTEPPYYAELGHAIPSGLSLAMEEKVIACVTKALQALEVNHGSVNMDLLITEAGGVHIIDVGARMGGNLIGSHIIPLGKGVDYMGNMIRGAVGDPCDFTPRAHPEAVATRLLAFRQGVLEKLPNAETLEREYNVEICHHMTEGMQVNEYHTNLDGCGYIVAKGENLSEAVEKATAVLAVYQAAVK